MLWFDDVDLGTRYHGAEIKVTRDDIKWFAAEFDSQPFQLDEVEAEKSIFKGLAALGWHTVALAIWADSSQRERGAPRSIAMENCYE